MPASQTPFAAPEAWSWEMAITGTRWAIAVYTSLSSSLNGPRLVVMTGKVGQALGVEGPGDGVVVDDVALWPASCSRGRGGPACVPCLRSPAVAPTAMAGDHADAHVYLPGGWPTDRRRGGKARFM